MHEVRVRVTNPSETETTFALEPWGEMYAMPPGAAFEIIAEGPSGDTLEVTFEDGSMVAWGWPGSRLRLLHGDRELGDSLTRPPVPA